MSNRLCFYRHRGHDALCDVGDRRVDGGGRGRLGKSFTEMAILPHYTIQINFRDKAYNRWTLWIRLTANQLNEVDPILKRGLFQQIQASKN